MRFFRNCVSHPHLSTALAIGALSFFTQCRAQEVITYSYDAMGRVTRVARSGGVVTGSVTGYQYDKADNRKAVTVTNSPRGDSGGSAGGGNGPALGYVVVPLNGFTAIPHP